MNGIILRIHESDADSQVPLARKSQMRQWLQGQGRPRQARLVPPDAVELAKRRTGGMEIYPAGQF